MEYRIYTFINWMLRSIQQGIQSAHVQQELVNKYSPDFGGENSLNPLGPNMLSTPLGTLVRWATEYKTMIVLNGGAQVNIETLITMFKETCDQMSFEVNVGLPWAPFYEDQASLGGQPTGVGIVLPESVFNAVDYRAAMNSVPDAKEFAVQYPLSDRDGAWFYLGEDKNVVSYYKNGSATSNFLNVMKRCSLAT